MVWTRIVVTFDHYNILDLRVGDQTTICKMFSCHTYLRLMQISCSYDSDKDTQRLITIGSSLLSEAQIIDAKKWDHIYDLKMAFRLPKLNLMNRSLDEPSFVCCVLYSKIFFFYGS